ncbi:MAG TPA: type IX secretion system sortase PorU [Ignavibacteriaceae bacterium]|nr:type IX secretion system sortase PorU [Ignavibacteriaceae bacterium]
MKSNISIIFLFIWTAIQIYPQDDLKIISSDFNSIVIEYTPLYDTLKEKINNQEFLGIDLTNGYIPDGNKWGEAAVPVRSINIGVPSEFGNTIEILNSSHKEISGKLLPIGKPKLKNDMLVSEYIVGDNYNDYRNDEELVSFGDFEIMRGIPTGNFIVKPVKFYPLENRIVIYNKIIFRINYSPNRKTTRGPEDQFLKGSLPNYEVAKFWKIERKKIKKTTVGVLSTGTWVRFEAPDEGIYKIDRALFASWGFDAASVDPRTIKIYNNGGKQLPETIEANHPSDLIENAIFVAGEEDSSFDAGDYILFYGRGINFWEYDTVSHSVLRYFTPYSKTNYFWITAGGNNGKRMQAKNGNLNQAQYVQSTTQAFASLEEDKVKVATTGRFYVGDEYSKSLPMKIYINKLDARIETTPITYKFRFINASEASLTLRVEENSNLLLSQGIAGFGNGDYSAGYQLLKTVVFNGPLTGNTSQLKFQITNASSTSKGYLDFFEIYYQKNLSAQGDTLIFFSKDTTAVVEYHLSGFSSSPNIKVYDITDFANVKIVANPFISGGEFRFQEALTSGFVSKYIGIGNDKFKVPRNPVNMPNENVTGISEAKLIIISNKNFKEAADRLKEYREGESKFKLSTSIAYIDEIYNEFSGGMTDPTALRNFIQYAYDNWTVKPEYVLLLGDGTYDAKNVENANNDFIPTYQVPLITNPPNYNANLSLINSYPVDDYFAQVDGNDLRIDLAIGRLNVQTINEANSVVDKIIDYETNMERGTWQNLITLVADDGWTTEGNDGDLHVSQSESLAKLIPKSFNINKIYLPAYPTVFTGGGPRKPEVNKAIINAINSGTLIVNYIGHGNHEVLAHEMVWENRSSISQIHNDKYFFLTAATCNFGEDDFTGTQSGTELLITMNGAGAIGALASTRQVYAESNRALNEDFYRRLLISPREEDNLTITIGKAYFLMKQGRTADNDRKFHLFGDPTIRLKIPQYNSSVDSINGILITSINNVQLKALSKARLAGTIKKPDNSLWEDYNGEAILSIFDSERSTTIVEKLDSITTNKYFITNPGGILFNGKISIVNGRYTADFVVPKDISYENKDGKALVYFSNSSSDGVGFTDRIIVGGSDSTAVNDGKGPDIEIHYDNPGPGSSTIINPDSRLIVNLSDETGLNTTGTGIGHKMEGILNDNESSPIDFTDYFTGDLDAGGKSGKINYQFTGLAEGNYKIKIKAWDVFNNFSSAESYFTVVDGNDLVIKDVYNYPNPFSSNTTFTFQKNHQSGIFDVKVKVYTVAGRMIKEIERINIGEDENFVKLDWDGRDQDGNPLANGVYLYKIVVKSADGQFSKSVLGKLAILR